jgi:hypothetical protein
MPGHARGGVHVNVPLTNLGIAVPAARSRLRRRRGLPHPPGRARVRRLLHVDAGRLLRHRRLRPRPGQDGAARVEFDATTASYQAQRRELAWDISDRERKNADNQLRLETVKQEGTLGRLALLRDMRIEALLQASGPSRRRSRASRSPAVSTHDDRGEDRRSGTARRHLQLDLHRRRQGHHEDAPERSGSART